VKNGRKYIQYVIPLCSALRFHSRSSRYHCVKCCSAQYSALCKWRAQLLMVHANVSLMYRSFEKQSPLKLRTNLKFLFSSIANLKHSNSPSLCCNMVWYSRKAGKMTLLSRSLLYSHALIIIALLDCTLFG